MSELKGACIFGQSGGPTSVINASAAGVFEEALKNDSITNVYGAAHGIRGMLDDVIYDISKEDPEELKLLLNSPSSALGSVRYKLKHFDEDETDYKKLLALFKKYDIRYFFYNGGNDSMDTCNKVSQYMQQSGYEFRVMGVPKTIDNDLWGTDHCPGFGSAAKYVATSCMEVSLDSRVYDTGMIVIMEVMGRNAGWLTAATALATAKGMGPNLIYLPEVAFSFERFFSDVKTIYESQKKVLIAVSEGIKDDKGTLISEYQKSTAKTDMFGHAQLGGVASYLAGRVGNVIDTKIRPIEFSLLQRCAAHCASKVDIEESYMSGKLAVQYATQGMSGYMVGFERGEGPVYTCKPKLFELTSVANAEKKIPDEWINKRGNGLTQAFIDYASPLISGEPELPRVDGLPRFAKLKKVRATV